MSKTCSGCGRKIGFFEKFGRCMKDDCGKLFCVNCREKMLLCSNYDEESCSDKCYFCINHIKEGMEECVEEDESYEDNSEDGSEYEDYCISHPCDNCGEQYDYEIPKGTKVKDYLKDKECESCGCKIMEED